MSLWTIGVEKVSVKKRTAVIGLCALSALLFAWRQSPGQQPAADSSQKALLNQYCVTCHNQKLKTGGLELDALDPDPLWIPIIPPPTPKPGKRWPARYAPA
jgi:hypothetical protein